MTRKHTTIHQRARHLIERCHIRLVAHVAHPAPRLPGPLSRSRQLLPRGAGPACGLIAVLAASAPAAPPA